MEKLTPKQVQEKLSKEKDAVCLVDVRGLDEFRSGHVPGAVCVPLDQIESGTASIPRDKLVILSCQAGRRSAKAKEVLKTRGFGNLVEMEGGFSAWSATGLPVDRLRNTIPVMRQVLITAGALVLTGSLLGIFVNQAFLTVPVFVGAGLTFAGITGWCGLAFLLERMPWNRS